MKQLFDRWLPALTLALWGGTILFYEFTGRLDEVLAAPFRTYALIASIFLLTGALIFALFRMEAACCTDSACGHGLSRSKTGRVLTFAIILLPLGLTSFSSGAINRQALQAVQAKNRIATDDSNNLSLNLRKQLEKKFANRPATPAAQPGSTPPAPALSDTPPPLPGSVLPPPPLPLPGQENATPPAAPAEVAKNPTDWLIRSADGNIVAEVIDLLYAAQDNTLRADFEGKRVELKGQFLPDSSQPGSKRFKAVRMFMTCCAADARPVATLVEVDQMPSFPDMQWIKITGIPTFPIEKGRRVSVLKAERIEKTEPIEEEVPQQQ